jgi:transcription termination factor Rho
VSDTTDLMGVRADNSVAPSDAAAPATGAATATAARRRRSGTGLDGMVLAELQQLASGLGIKGTARMRKSQLIETIKERQASAGAPAPAAQTAAPADAAAADKPKRRATSRTRLEQAAAESGAAPSATATATAPPEPAAIVASATLSGATSCRNTISNIGKDRSLADDKINADNNRLALAA